ncbi:MAG: WD40 repeat domain-containing protein [Armatimonadota bacterium]
MITLKNIHWNVLFYAVATLLVPLAGNSAKKINQDSVPIRQAKLLWEFKQNGTINCMDFSPDGSRLVCSSDNSHSNLGIWDTKTGRQLGYVNTYGKIAYSRYTSDGKTIVTEEIDVDGKGRTDIRIKDGYTGKLKHVIPTDMTDPGWGLAVSKDSELAAAGDYIDHQPCIRLYDLRTLKEKRVMIFPYELMGIGDIAFSPDGKLIACPVYSNETGEANLDIWDITTGKRVQSVGSCYEDIGRYTFFIGSSRRIISCYMLINIMQPKNRIRRAVNDIKVIPKALYTPETNLVLGFVGKPLKMVEVWDILTQKKVHRWKITDSSVYYKEMAYSQSNRLLALSKDQGSTVKVFSLD